VSTTTERAVPVYKELQGFLLCNIALIMVKIKRMLSISSILLCTALSITAQPASWQEHWFEHVQNVQRVFSDSDVAIYYDSDVDRSITWPNKFLGDVWRYTKRNYGNFSSDGLLYAIFHTGKYSGGHPSTYFDASHDFRDVIDCGSSDSNAWKSGTDNDLDVPAHEVAHVVEFANNGVKGSPAFRLWGDSKWAEIFIYDVYNNLWLPDATRSYNLNMEKRDNFPRENTAWFRDWFYPIYSHGGSAVLSRFFKLLSENFPRNEQSYSRDMNWGEFVHFWSGAAGVNLKPLATTAFHWPDDWETMFQNAKRDFPNIRYIDL